MLSKRTNILFDEKMWDTLTQEAKRQKKSVGAVVRYAIERTYVSQEQLKERRDAIDSILKTRKYIKPIKPSEIKELINYGRKY